MKQGIITETNKEYHSDLTAISKSQLAKMSVCPKYFKHCLDNPQMPTTDLIIGSAFHKLVLEPETFGKEFVVMPMIDKRTKLGKEAYEQFLLSSEGREIITEEQYNTISNMATAVLENCLATALTTGNIETSLYGIDELTGEHIKTRPDCYQMIDNRLVITDLKSCVSAMQGDFTRDCVKYSYDLQAYMYSYNASKVLDIPMDKIDFVFIAVEKKPPYLLNIFKASKDILERGEMLYREYIGMYHEAKTTNNWWGYNGKENIINDLSLPTYLLRGEQD